MRRVPNVVAVVNAKGGVGKTAVVANVAASAAADGNRVLAVDLDERADLAIDLGYRGTDADDKGAALAKALTGRNGGAPRVVGGVRPNLDVLAGGHGLAISDAHKACFATSGGHSLASVLSRISDRYDLILLDCPPRVGPISRLALAAADGVVIPVRADDASLAAIDTLAGQWRDVQGSLNPTLTLLGIALTQIPADTSVLRRALRNDLNHMDTNLPVFRTVIRDAPDAVYHLRRHGRTAADYAHPTQPAPTDRAEVPPAVHDLAEDYAHLADEVIERLWGRLGRPSKERP